MNFKDLQDYENTSVSRRACSINIIYFYSKATLCKILEFPFLGDIWDGLFGGYLSCPFGWYLNCPWGNIWVALFGWYLSCPFGGYLSCPFGRYLSYPFGRYLSYPFGGIFELPFWGDIWVALFGGYLVMLIGLVTAFLNFKCKHNDNLWLVFWLFLHVFDFVAFIKAVAESWHPGKFWWKIKTLKNVQCTFTQQLLQYMFYTLTFSGDISEGWCKVDHGHMDITAGLPGGDGSQPTGFSVRTTNTIHTQSKRNAGRSAITI